MVCSLTRYQVSKLRTKDLIAVILVFSILASALLILPPQGVYAATVFTDNYETGTYSNWSGTVNTSSSMQMSTNTSLVFAGNYSADCQLDGTNGTYAYAYTNLSAPQPTTLYHREYIRISALPPAGTEIDLFGIMDIIGSGHHLGTIGIQNDGSNYLWRLKYYDGSDKIAYSAPANIKNDTWYYVEIMVQSGPGNGTVSVWVAEDLTNVNQASSIINLTNLTNDANPIGAVFFGGYILGTSYPDSVHIYSDSVEVSDSSWIGPRDFTAPTIGAINATSQSIGSPVTLTSSITDDVGVDYVIPSWNNTGAWVNQTAIDAQGNTNYTATLTGNWNSTPGTVVSARFYANDTSNNWATGNQTDFALSTYGVTLSANQTGLTQEDTVNIALAVTKNGLPFSNYLANVTKDGSLFLKNQTTSFTDMEVHAVTRAYAVLSLYDGVTGENVSFTANTLNVVWASSTYGVTLSANPSSPVVSNAVTISLSVSKNGLPFSHYVANVSRDGIMLQKNATASFDNIETAAVSHAFTVSSLYDEVTGEDVTFTTNTVSVTWVLAPTPTPTLTPSPTPTTTPSPTATPSPTPTPTLTPSSTPKPANEGLSTEALIGIAIAIAIIIIVIVAYLIIKKPKLIK